MLNRYLFRFAFTYQTKTFFEFDDPLLDIAIEVRVVLSKLLALLIQRCEVAMNIDCDLLRALYR